MNKSIGRKVPEYCNPINTVKIVTDSFKQDKLKNQREGRNEHNTAKSRIESIKLTKTRSGPTEPNKLKKQIEDCKAVNARTGNESIKPRKLKKQTEYCKDIKVAKTKSECIKPSNLKSKTEHKKYKSASECRIEEIESSFNLLQIPLACGDFCFQQKETTQDNKLIVLYENYSHKSEDIINNMDTDKTNEEPKETAGENPGENEPAGVEQEEHIEPPPPDMTKTDPAEQEPPAAEGEDHGKPESTEPAPPDVAPEGPGDHEGAEPDKTEETAGEKPGESEPVVSGPGDHEVAEPDKTEIKKPRRVSLDSNIPHTDSKIQEELQDAKKRGILTTKAIEDLQKSVNKLTQKEQLTYEEAMHLRKTQGELLSKLSEFEQLTRHVARMIKMTEVPSSQLDMAMPFPHQLHPGASSLEPVKEESPEKSPPPKKQFSEEKLPKVIVCGTGADDNVPKIIVCEPMKDCDTQPFSESESSLLKSPEGEGGTAGREGRDPPKRIDINGDVIKGLLERVDGCFSAQQKMFAENMQLEKSRYELQMELLRKDQVVEDLVKKVNKLQNDMQTIIQQNVELQQQCLLSCQPPQPPMCRKQLCEKFAMISNEFGTGGGTEENREPEVKPTGDVGTKDLNTTQDGKCSPKQNEELKGVSFWGQVPFCKLMLPTKATQTDGLEFDPIFVSEAEPEYRTLQEQYCRIQMDYRNKITEVSSLRNELTTLKQETEKQCLLLKETETMLQELLEANKYLEAEKHKLLLYRDQFIELEQQTNLAKQKLRVCEEEGEDIRQVLTDQTAQLESYRTKYLCISQLHEELKQEMELKSKEYCEKLSAAELQIKEKEEEYLEEITVLKTMLQDVQTKLEDKTQLHSIAIDNITELTKQIQGLTTENEQLKAQLYSSSNEEKMNQLLYNHEVTEKKLEEVQLENARLRLLTNRLEAIQSENNRRFEEKSHENSQLITQLETLREESARQVARVKDRCDMVKKSMQTQITEMETELIQSRAALCAAKKDKDEVRQKMQLQIMNLNDNFNDAQAHIQQLLNHVMYLKTSYTQFLMAGGVNPCSSLLNDEDKSSVKPVCGS